MIASLPVLFAANYPWWAFDLPFWTCVIFVLLAATVIAMAGRPLNAAMKSREERIVTELEMAAKALEEIRIVREKQAAERERLLREARELIEEAKRDCVQLRADLIAKAEGEAARIRARIQREIQLLENRALSEIWDQLGLEASAIADGLLRRRLTAADHRRLVADSIAEIAAFKGTGVNP